MPMNRKGLLLFSGGALMAMVSIILGNSLQLELRNLPVDILLQQEGPNSAKFFAFAFGFPFGIGISLLGALTGSETSAGRLWFFLGVAIMGTLAAGIVPILWGRQLTAMFFGNGGYSLMLLILGSIWYWGRYRARLVQSARLAIDLQGLGYLCFAIGVWNICGVVTMPSFALEPTIMLSMDSQAFAIGQMKAIMLLFILGWIFTLLGLRLASQEIMHQDATGAR